MTVLDLLSPLMRLPTQLLLERIGLVHSGSRQSCMLLSVISKEAGRRHFLHKVLVHQSSLAPHQAQGARRQIVVIAHKQTIALMDLELMSRSRAIELSWVIREGQ